MSNDPDTMGVEEFAVDKLPPGSKSRVHLVVDRLPGGQALYLPALVARGTRPGKTLLATGGTHGDEYEGMVAIQDVFRELSPEDMAGTFFGIPVLNGPAFAAGARDSGLDGLNLARAFPGSAAGSPTQRIANVFQEQLLGECDLYLDVHSGGGYYAIKELAGYQIRPGEVGEIQREAAVAFGLDLVWATSPMPGRTLSAAWEKGVPAIYVEVGCEGRLRPQSVAKVRRGIMNLLAMLGIQREDCAGVPAVVGLDSSNETDGAGSTCLRQNADTTIYSGSCDVARAGRDHRETAGEAAHMGFIAGRMNPLSRPPRYVVEDSAPDSGHLQVDHPSPTSGIFVSAVSLWDRVEDGQALGWVRHPDGTVLAEVPVSRPGRILFLRTFPRVISGDSLAYVLELEET